MSRSLTTARGFLQAWQPESPRRRSALPVEALGSVSRCRIADNEAPTGSVSRQRSADASPGEPVTAAPSTTNSRPRPRVFPARLDPELVEVSDDDAVELRIAPVRRLRWAGRVPILLGFPVGNLLANIIVGKIDTIQGTRSWAA
jgi:hypothetical protein